MSVATFLALLLSFFPGDTWAQAPQRPAVAPSALGAPREPRVKQSRGGAKRVSSRSNDGDSALEQKGQNSLQLGSIKAIHIQGQRKIEADAIRAKLTSRVGAAFSTENVREDVKEIFNTGYFYDVEVNREDEKGLVILTYSVVEKPSIAEIEYVGNNEVSDEDLSEQTSLKAYEILNLTKVGEAIEKLEKFYQEKGFFLARITHRVVNTSKDDSVKLVFDVVENDKVQVKKITFLGNSNISSSRIKSAMITKEVGFFSFISGSGAYKQEAFDRDVQLINYLYFNEGYVQVKVDKPQVYVTPDKKGIYVTIAIEEGPQFNVGDVDFSGDLLFSKDELFESVKIDESGLFVYETLQEDLRVLQAKYGDLGYAFANIIPRTHVKEKERVVDVTFDVDRGSKVYLGKISMIGNSKTRDKVIRRELRVREGELYNETRKRESLARVKRLGFFEEVNFNTKTLPDRNDLMDIEINVKERNTGTIQVGAGYSSFQHFVFNGQINQINLLGRGQKLGASVDIAKRQETFRLSFTEPYTFDTEWSTGFDLERTRRTLFAYKEIKRGAAVRLGHPLAPYLDGFVRYRLYDTELELRDEGDEDLFPVETANGTTSSLTFTLEYDKRNDRFEPSKGVLTSLSLEYAGVGGEKKYTRGFATFRYYQELFWNLVWRNNLNYAFISSNDSNNPAPFNELFLLGGANSLRGYDWFSVGRKKFSRKAFNEAVSAGVPNARDLAMRPFGGTQQLYYNLEMQFPLIAEAGIKGVLFYDVGAADDALVLDDFRQDWGFGFRWFSPIGPLRFEWGFPIQRRKEFDEEPVNFQFAIGSPF